MRPHEFVILDPDEFERRVAEDVLQLMRTIRVGEELIIRRNEKSGPGESRYVLTYQHTP